MFLIATLIGHFKLLLFVKAPRMARLTLSRLHAIKSEKRSEAEGVRGRWHDREAKRVAFPSFQASLDVLAELRTCLATQVMKRALRSSSPIPFESWSGCSPAEDTSSTPKCFVPNEPRQNHMYHFHRRSCCPPNCPGWRSIIIEAICVA